MSDATLAPFAHPFRVSVIDLHVPVGYSDLPTCPMKELRPFSLLLCCLIGWLSASCSLLSTSKPVELSGATRQLPYRVALVPVEPSEYVVDGEPDEEGLLDLKGAGAGRVVDPLTEHLHASLEENVFNDVVILDGPAEGAATEAHWVHEAKRVGADLILDVDEVRYTPKIKQSGIWSSYLLYLIGPVELFFPDRSYRAQDCVMQVSLYDVNLMRDVPEQAPASTETEGRDPTDQQEASPVANLAASWLMDRDALLREIRVSPKKMRLQYGDRLDGGLGVWPVIKATVIPSAWLDTDGDFLRGELSDRVALGLATSLSERIVQGDEVYINAPSPRVARFHLRAEPRATWRDGRLEIDLAVDRYRTRRFTSGQVVVDGERYDLDIHEGLDGGLVQVSEAAGGSKAIGVSRLTPEASDGKDGFESDTVRIELDLNRPRVIEASLDIGRQPATARPQWVQIVLEENTPGEQQQVRSWTVQVKEG